ncbi:MAG: hypothetical protein HY913_13095 [Desulfomonile tiedjei]|nr:hypothetical protein [Desulfomonile tiedjei]
MNEISEIALALSRIRDLIQKPIRDFNYFLGRERKWKTPIEARLIATGKPNTYKARPVEEKLLWDLVHNRLGHIIVRKNDRFNANALVESYVYHQDQGEVDALWVNQNPESTYYLVTSLIQAAQKFRKVFLDKNRVDRAEQLKTLASAAFTVLYGARGSGKTFFLNHVISKYTKIFDEAKVIWVRVNLAREFSSIEDLLHIVYAQAAKIVLRYYDVRSIRWEEGSPKPIGLDLSAELDIWLSEVSDMETRKDMGEKVAYLKYSFMQAEEAPESADPEIVPKLIGRRVFEHAMAKGYAFILVLDGVDRLEALPYHKQRYQKVKRGLRQLLAGVNNLGCPIVGVARTDTLRDLSATRGSFPSNYFEARLRAVNFKRIVERRINYISGEMKELSKLPEYSNLGDWQAHLNEFLDYLKRRNREGKSWYQVLDGIHPDNNRAKVNALLVLHYEFARVEENKSYLLLESLLRGGYEFPRAHYVYKLKRDGLLERTGSNNRFETNLLPNIFTFPFTSTGQGVTFPTDGHGLLAGLRILQLAAATERLRKGKQKPPLPIAADLIALCKILFEYEEELLLNLIEEYGEFEIFYLGGMHYDQPSHRSRWTIKCSLKLDILLSDLIYDVAYLNLCSMCTPLERKRVPWNKNPFLQASSVKSDGVEEWVLCKITNAVSFFRLIKSVNEYQEKRCQKTSKALDEDQRKVYEEARNHLTRGVDGLSLHGLFSFTATMQASILKQCQTILDPSEPTLPLSIGSNLLKRLDNYERAWATH